MREANRAVLALDDVRGNGRFEGLDRDAGPAEQRLRRRAERGGERERPAGGCRKCGDPRADELLERLGDRERLQRVDVGVEDAGELEREERIAARPLVDAKQRLAREGRAEPVAQESVESTGAQRSDGHSPDAIAGKLLLDPRRRRLVTEPAREQQEHSIRIHPAQRKGKCAGGRRVEPLHVVHGDENGVAFAEKLEEAAHRDGERTAIDGFVRSLVEEQRDLERAPPRRCQSGQKVDGFLEQIAEPRVSKTALGFGRSRHEHAHASRTSARDAGEPERGLADSRLALEDERGCALFRCADEGVDGGELLIPADDLRRHLPSSVAT